MLCNIVSGDFTPVLAKHSKHFNFLHSLEIGVSEMQRNFEPMINQVSRWRESQLTDVAAKLIIYQAFIEGATDLPKHLAAPVHGVCAPVRAAAWTSRSG